MYSLNNITVLSANCQGLCTYEKRIDGLSYMKETGASIVCLQDIHLTEREITSVKQIWLDCYINGVRHNSRAVAILLNNNFEYNVLEVNKDDQGNYLQVMMCVSNITINLITIYSPNQDNPSFFNKIRELAETGNTDYTLICGDFNRVLDPDKDSYNYLNINNPNARKCVIETVNDLDLIDIYRYLHPHEKQFSWRKKTPLKQARLDYFLLTSAMTDIIDKCNINPSYRSDHSIIEL